VIESLANAMRALGLLDGQCIPPLSRQITL